MIRVEWDNEERKQRAKEALRKAIAIYRGKEEHSPEIAEILLEMGIISPFAIQDLEGGWCYTCSHRTRPPEGEELVHDEIWCGLRSEPRPEDGTCGSYTVNLEKLNPLAGLMVSPFGQQALEIFQEEARKRGLGVPGYKETPANWWKQVCEWIKSY